MASFLTPEVQEIALSLMAGLNCARSVTVSMLIRAGEWAQLVKLQCKPSDYCDAESYLRSAAATNFLKKLDGTIPGVDPEAAAIEKWWAAEKQCFNTNRRLNELLDFGTLAGAPANERLLEFVEQLKKNVQWLVGYGPSPIFQGAFGPGATISDHHLRTSVMHKMSTIPTFTPSAWPYLVPWTGTKWAEAVARRGEVSQSVRGNKFFTVPKEATIRRSCAKEPSINGFYQLGLGREMRSRLKERGIDLDNGQDVHRQVACVASESDEFCTIDLSSASDTVCTALVRAVLPSKWLHCLEDLRSPLTQIGKRWVLLEKFSSMGNGFTFELETTLFTAISMTAAGLTPGKDLWVYGDDIIVPKRSAHDVLWALKFFGFTPNLAKTFVEGPFRESCGGDFYDGVPVRAHYLKELPSEPQQYIALANGIRRLSLQLGLGSQLYRDLRKAWFRCLDQIPSTIRRCRGPVQLGDLVIHDDEAHWVTRWRASGIRFVQVYRPARFRGVGFTRFDEHIQFAAALYGVLLYPRDPSPRWKPGYDGRQLILRDGVEGYKVGWLPFS